MVQERDAKKKRIEWYQAFCESKAKQLEEETVRFSWHVVEYIPGYNTGGYYDTDIPPKRIKVSPDFDTEQEAKDWLERHEPDPGNSLYIQRMRLRRQVTLRWVNY